MPTLLISAKDDLYKTYPKAEYAAKFIPNAKFMAFESGGHLLLRHDSEVREISSSGALIRSTYSSCALGFEGPKL